MKDALTIGEGACFNICMYVCVSDLQESDHKNPKNEKK